MKAFLQNRVARGEHLEVLSSTFAVDGYFAKRKFIDHMSFKLDYEDVHVRLYGLAVINAGNNLLSNILFSNNHFVNFSFFNHNFIN
ncbi:hypothetical protein N8364_02955 [Saprospiraceae bacterium]|nr:hypothetical protein [Saprospiraceae bacterium]